MDIVNICMVLKKVVCGYCFLYLNVTFGTLNIIPDWVGYVILLGVLTDIGEAEPSAELLRPLGKALAWWEGIVWGLRIFGISAEGYMITIIASVVSLYFHFQLLTNLAGLIEDCQCVFYKRIMLLRTGTTVLLTAALSLTTLQVSWIQQKTVTTVIGLVYFGMLVWMCVVMLRARRWLEYREFREKISMAVQELGEN